MPPGALPWLALGGIAALLVASAGIAAFWLALARATTPEARSATIREAAIAAILFGLFLVWAGTSAAELMALLNDPDRDPRAVEDFLVGRIYCALWLCL